MAIWPRRFRGLFFTRDERALTRSGTLVDLVEFDFPAQRIAMNAQEAGSAGLIAVGAVQSPADESLFELVDRLVKQNATIYHLANQGIELISHDGTLR
jgi:hypothetical protein